MVRELCVIVNRVPGKILTRKYFREAKRNSISSTMRDVKRSPTLHLETIKVIFYDCLNLLSLIIVGANHTLWRAGRGKPQDERRWPRRQESWCSHLSDLKEDLAQINIQIQKHSIPRNIHWKVAVACIRPRARTEPSVGHDSEEEGGPCHVGSSLQFVQIIGNE